MQIREEVLSSSMTSFVEFCKKMFCIENDFDFLIHLRVDDLAPLPAMEFPFSMRFHMTVIDGPNRYYYHAMFVLKVHNCLVEFTKEIYNCRHQ